MKKTQVAEHIEKWHDDRRSFLKRALAAVAGTAVAIKGEDTGKATVECPCCKEELNAEGY